MFGEVGTGLGLILASFVIGILAWVLLRLLPRREHSVDTIFTSDSTGESQSADAVIVIQLGGRVEYISRLAREWFGCTKVRPLTSNAWHAVFAPRMSSWSCVRERDRNASRSMGA
jgi:hypothetical protein